MMSRSWPAHAYPPEPMVDTHTSYPPPLPPKPVKRKTQSLAQSLLLALVILTLFGMVIGACLIYDLYRRQALYAKEIEENEDTPQLDSQKQSETTTPNTLFKPMAHVIGKKKPDKDGVMPWEAVESPERLDEIIMHGVKYENGRIIILKEGYYSIYSKLHLKEPTNHMILHSVVKKTTRYPNEIVLMRSKKFRRKGDHSDTTNSYLGGVFHLLENDAVYVKVNNHTEVILQKSSDNYFGVHMR